MNSKHRAFRPVRSLLAAALAFAALPAAAQTYSQTVFFGDSLTDSGWYRPALSRSPVRRPRSSGNSAPTRRWSGPNTSPTTTAPMRPAEPGRHQLGRRRRQHRHRHGRPAAADIPSLSTQITVTSPPPAAAPIRTRCTPCGAARTTCSRSPAARPRRRDGRGRGRADRQRRTLTGAGAQYILVPTVPDLGLTPGSARRARRLRRRHATGDHLQQRAVRGPRGRRACA